MKPKSRSKIVIALILAISCILVMSTSLCILYTQHIKNVQERLTLAVQSQAQLIEAVAHYDSLKNTANFDVSPSTLTKLTLNRIKDAHLSLRGFGQTGEFTLAELHNDTIFFQFRHRHAEIESPQPVPMNSTYAEPMRKALEGKSGVIKGLDYQGELVLAAFEPLEDFNMGVVAKIDMEEVQAPFLTAVCITSAVSIVIIFLGVILVLKSVRPLLSRLRNHTHDLEQQIEKRKVTEEELQRYKDIVSNSIDSLAFIDTDTIYRTMNPQYLEAIGKTREQVIGKTISEVLGQEFYNREVKPRLDRCMSGAKTQHEDSIEHPEKGVRYFDVNYYPCFGKDNRLSGITINRRDITQRKVIEEQLSLQARLIESVSDAIISVDNNHRIRSWNTAAEYMYGWKAAEVLDHPIDEILETQYTRCAQEEFLHTIQGTGCWSGETEQKRKNGTAINTLASVAKILDSAGAESGMVGIYRDITEIKASEKALKKSEEQFRLICSAARDPIIMIDDRGDIVIWNDAAEKLFGFTRKEVKGKPIHQMIAPDRFHSRSAAGLEVFREAGKGNAIGKTLELTARKKDGTEFPIELSLSNANRDGKWHAIGVLRDISERKKAEAERENLEKQLRQSQKMETIGTLAGGIAHDFNNILVPILMTSQVLMDEADEDSQLHKDVRQINIAAKRAKDLVKHILTFSRQNESEKICVELTPIVKEVRKLLESSLPTTIELSYELDPNCGQVSADPTQIHQVLMNFCTNAYQAIGEENGRIRIGMRKVRMNPTKLKTGEYTAESYVVLSVEDTGPGIKPETIDRIFEPFYTTKEVGKGTGLGLSVAHGIAKNHDGFITVDSQLNSGTTFSLYLPALETAGETSETVEEMISGGNEKILLVEDDESAASTFTKMLEKLGYHVTNFTDSQNCLDAIKSNPNDYQLLLTDQVMPRMTGDQLLSQIREIEHELPAIVMTGYSSTITDLNFKDFGFDGFLMKPVISRELNKEIRRILDSRSLRTTADPQSIIT
jgi:PAS domain S-box-containing protein